MPTTPKLTQIDLRRRSRVLHLTYSNDKEFELSFEFSGSLEVACDITNELFQQPMETNIFLIVKLHLILINICQL